MKRLHRILAYSFVAYLTTTFVFLFSSNLPNRRNEGLHVLTVINPSLSLPEIGRKLNDGDPMGGEEDGDGRKQVSDLFRRKQPISESLTTYIFKYGKPYRYNPQDEHPDKQPPPNRSSSKLIIDSATVGSKFNLHQMEAQLKTWGRRVRYFFGSTEDDDHDQDCHKALTMEDIHKIINICSSKQLWRKGMKLRALRNAYFKMKWFTNQNKKPSWMCAQHRFARTMGKIGRFYRDEDKALPDYLFVGDDDTFYGMNSLIKHLEQHNPDPSRAYVTAGCVIKWSQRYINFTFPIGGFGVMFSKGAIQRLIEPITNCGPSSSTKTTTTISSPQCQAVRDNYISEGNGFQEGMSVADVMDFHTKRHPFTNLTKWGRPKGHYCLLGDWILGYFANFYNLGDAPDTEFAHSWDQHRLEEGMGFTDVHDPQNECNLIRDNCLLSFEEDGLPPPRTCHNINVEQMHACHKRDEEQERMRL